MSRKLKRWARRVGLTVAAAAGLLLAAALAFVLWPLPEGLLSREALSSLVLTDRQGGLLREVRSREDGRAVPLPPGPLPPQVRAAFLAAEDRRFEAHLGVDALAVARALAQNLRAGRVVSGASTLTQQLARRLLTPPGARRPRGVWTKLEEALWAVRLSLHLPKERVLREYLDRVALGHNTYGVEAAAQLYFGRPARSLSAGQAALLAGLACSPSRYDPYRQPARARARMSRVLGRMAALGWLTPERARSEAVAGLDLVPAEQVFRAPHLGEALLARLGERGLEGAARIETSLDPGLQADVEALVRDELQALGDRRVGQAAVLVVDNRSGEVLAYVGSRDFLDPERLGQNDGVRARRQPGSALKPFAYGLALSRGFTPATVLSDVEVHLSTPGGDYVPRNYDRRAHGPVRLRAALANSYNIPAVRVTERLGPERVLEVLRRAGLESLDRAASHYGVGVVLGNGDVSLWELARAFRGLALGGQVRPLTEVRAAWDGAGRPLALRPELVARRFLPEDAVALLTDILADEGARAPAFGLDNALRLPFPVAAKTGTSRGHVDNWCAGFTRERTVAVWVGNFDGAAMRRVSGITGAGPLFRRIMLRAMRGLDPAPLVARGRFAAVDICPLSGARATAACPGVLHELFLPGSEPSHACPMHRQAAPGLVALDVGPEFYAWARAEGLSAGPAAAPPGETAAPGGGRGRLLMPGDGDRYLLEPDLPAADQSVPVRAVAPAGVSRLELRLDGQPVAELGPPFVGRVPAARGAHRLEVWLPAGERPLWSVGYVVR
ncbi:MAG TPA: transglycosylase domain-containing protein [Myxococcota bacterium]|nr:transglycosylase domain-containing protein [Myxococcota bacterium]HRY95536.1 transglycosylase domain-containing protein [Myxococcota bacterium]HSA19938.1 transglycosylase domain-containing protein [Myxococcota bacterium]